MCDCISSSLAPFSYKFPSSTQFLSSFQKKPIILSLKISKNPNPSSSTSDQPQFLQEIKETRNTQLEFDVNLSVHQDFKYKDQETENTQMEFDVDLSENGEKDEDLVEIRENLKEFDVGNKKDQVKVVRKGRELMKRSNIVAKQVISIESALCLGFVSQLWVDTNTWRVVIVEVRPNLLSGEQEMFFLEDTKQVGDVVLIKDETVMDNEFKMVGLETLVGYNVVTPGRRDIGKVRGYTFNINSGVVESLELDSFGISIIPSSLVSTYALLVEDILEVLLDTIVVHEAAASRIQRLTKGFWGAEKMNYSMDDLDDYSDLERQSEYRKGRRRRSGAGNQRPRDRPIDDPKEDWDLPMDYL
uniref:uncharacterized protein LOC122607291 n=1 Tax=Erigeron canadensis TaxID=72917 RepID=UPI001CB8E798|nr:uncharacterized protein LOC122607291 [Erigeron canadensis]